MDVEDVAAAAHEGQRDDVEPGVQGPPQVVLVLLGQRGHGHGDAGEVDALVVGDHPALDDPGPHARAVDRGDLEGDLAVVDEDAFARGDVLGETGVGGSADVAVALHALFDGDGEGVAAFKEYGSLPEAAEPDLRA